MAKNETPTDSSKGKGSHPKRGIRKRVLGEGEGDYCIYEIASQGSPLPAGALIPIPEVPRFEDTVKAMTWLRKESGDLLAGKQVMIFRAMEILSLQVENKPTVTISAKPKVVVTMPAETAAG
ncbi:MAG: hypothetical protein GY906_23630 [bacterium]|nr:hypothetical protein [bacterium]